MANSRDIVLPLERALRWRRTQLVESTDRVAVLSHVHEAGAFGPRFAFMTLMACGIAMLGLLQNSAAVIIGAMLVAPLMGPIIELGMGLATFDLRSIRTALWTIAIGILLALAMAMLIVWLSPLKQATPEILARTQPTLFDLLVAVFSGLAGAYATITRKGEAIVGVAIATALMPPLAVVGYGLVLRNGNIAGGAALLLMTNLLAIALSATIMARWYGFGGSDTPKQTAWQVALIIGTFVLLSIPLGLSLRQIARQSGQEVAVRQTLDAAAAELQGRVSGLRVERREGTLLVDAVLTSSRHRPGLEQDLSRQLSDALGEPVTVDLREVLTADDAAIASQQASLAELRKSVDALQAASSVRDSGERAQARVRDAWLARLGALERGADGQLQWRLRSDSGLDIALAQALERSALAEDGTPLARVVPPLQALAPIEVDAGQDAALPAPATAAASLQLWALQRWQAGTVVIDVQAGDEAVARQQAAAVAQLARQAGLEVSEVRTRRATPGRLVLAAAGVQAAAPP